MTKFSTISYPSKHVPWRPADNALLAATFDPVLATISGAPAAGQILVGRIWVPETITIATFNFCVETVATTPTAGQNFAGIYSSAGTLLGKAAIDSHVAGTGVKSPTLTAEAGQSLTIVGGPDVWIYEAMLQNASATASLRRQSVTAALLNFGLAAADGYRAGVTAGGQTSLAASLPALATVTYLPWVGLS